jgi:transposase
MTKRKFTKEFKTQAVDLAASLGNATEAARQLGIPVANIHNWKLKNTSPIQSEEKFIFAASEMEELKRLRRENGEQKKVIHILKAAAAFFSQDHLK